jgi:hypothetical protein
MDSRGNTDQGPTCKEGKKRSLSGLTGNQMIFGQAQSTSSPTGSLALSVLMPILPPSPIGLAKLLPCPTCSYILTRFLMHGLHIALMMEAVSTSEMMANIYWTTQCNIPEHNHFHTCHHKNLKSHQVYTWAFCTVALLHKLFFE